MNSQIQTMMPVSKSRSSSENEAQYSFAVEYTGPPLPFDLPRAVPISVEKIPTATVVSKVSLSNNDLHIPVAPPISGPDRKGFSKELNPSVSPTSVINIGDSVSNELESGSEATVCLSSVIGFEERVAEERNNCGLSDEFSSSGALEYENYGSGELSDVGNSCSRGVGSCSHSNEHFSTIEYSDSFDKLRESSSEVGVSNDGKGSFDFNDDLNQPDWASNESVLSSDYRSSRVSSFKTGDCICVNENGDVRRPPVVTFRDIELEDGVDEDYSQDEQPRVLRVERAPQTKVKKGLCYRCLKRNRFTEKEFCLVCDAKYCSNCVLRAMGSMPEGRKCVTCIGNPIDESKRGSLGKCSRMLKRLLNDLEVRQIMNAEKLCEANQLPPEYISVNGKPLCNEELAVLQTCPNPPNKLKLGNYWYDKVSGLWGKEGQKPSKIISPHLNVGGPIKADASNGKTQVFINGREITKAELRMLQLAGVQCAGNPHFWVNEDGSYQEEGQKNTRGYIWGKAGMKLVCAVLSLPIPSKSWSPCGEQISSMASRSVPDYFGQRIMQKILLVGSSGSGTSTIFKQGKILYKDIPFSEAEIENIKTAIQTNVYGYVGVLLEGCERFEEESLPEMRKNGCLEETDPKRSTNNVDRRTVYSIAPRLKAFSDWLLKAMVSGNLEDFPAATREYAPLIEELWKDAAIQATYSRRSELEMLPSVASYFLERAVDILKADYHPSDLDILYAEGVTSSNGLACMDFTFPHFSSENNIDATDQHDSMLRYQLIRLQSRGLGENCKWLEMFEDVGLVIFCVALSDYDQFSEDGTNKMLLSRKFFESIVTHPTFEEMNFLLILNKFDIFEEMIESVPLNQCDWFDDFHPLISHHHNNPNSNSINHNPTLGQLGFHYIAVKFKRLYSSLTGRKLYVSLVKGLDPRSVDAALKFAREVLKWDEERHNFSFSEHSFYSNEASSFSN